MKRTVEVRYGDDFRMRAFTIFPDNSVRISWSTFSERASELVRKYSAGEMARLLGTERHHFNLTAQQAQAKLSRWQKQCTKVGLTHSVVLEDRS